MRQDNEWLVYRPLSLYNIINYLAEHALYSRYSVSDDVVYSELGRLLQERQYTNILEIGRAGSFSLAIMSYFSPDSLITSIDPEVVPKSVAYGKKIIDLIRPNCDLIVGTTDDLSKPEYNERKFDFVFLDGCHTDGWPQKDWENIKDRLTPTAVLVFDDYYFPDVKDAFSMTEGEKFYVEVSTGFSHGTQAAIVKVGAPAGYLNGPRDCILRDIV